MTISMISNIAANMGAAANSAATAAIDGLPIDFAALLSAQALTPPESTSPASFIVTKSKSENTSALPEKTEKAGEQPLDPSILASMLGIAQLPPASPPAQGATKPVSENQENGALLKGIPEQKNPMSKNPDLPSPNKDIAAVTSSLQETEHQASSTTKEAANIAADSARNTGMGTDFEAALASTTAPLQNAVAKQATINAPLTSSAWPGALSEKIVWLAKSDQQTAQININPPQLGPVQITLNLTGDQASALFASPHLEVRNAIESSLPHLREMLASAGINLGDASVGANLSQQGQEQPFQSANKAHLRSENAILPANENATSTGSNQVLQRGRGLVDLFA